MPNTVCLPLAESNRPSLYTRLLGGHIAQLPASVQRIHKTSLNLSGTGNVMHGSNILARLIVRLTGLPKAGRRQTVHISIQRQQDDEIWTRNFNNVRFTTRLAHHRQYLDEHFGPFSLLMHIEVRNFSLVYRLQKLRFFSIPLPRFLTPRIDASEIGIGEDILFRMEMSFPWIGRIIRYCGHVRIAA